MNGLKKLSGFGKGGRVEKRQEGQKFKVILELLNNKLETSLGYRRSLPQNTNSSSARHFQTTQKSYVYGLRH